MEQCQKRSSAKYATVKYGTGPNGNQGGGRQSRTARKQQEAEGARPGRSVLAGQVTQGLIQVRGGGGGPAGGAQGLIQVRGGEGAPAGGAQGLRCIQVWRVPPGPTYAAGSALAATFTLPLESTCERASRAHVESRVVSHVW
eukprot:585439-Prymnesium_polylepis.1